MGGSRDSGQVQTLWEAAGLWEQTLQALMAVLESKR